MAGRIRCAVLGGTFLVAAVVAMGCSSQSQESVGETEEGITEAQRPNVGLGIALGGAGSDSHGDCTMFSAPHTYDTAAGGTFTTLGFTGRYGTSEDRSDSARSSESATVVLWVPMRNVERDQTTFACVQKTPATVPAAVVIDAGFRVTPTSDAWKGFMGFNALAVPLDGCGAPAVPELAPGQNLITDAITEYFAADTAGAFSKCKNAYAPAPNGGGGGGGGAGGPGGPPALRTPDDGALPDVVAQQLDRAQKLIAQKAYGELGARARAGEFDALRDFGRKQLPQANESLMSSPALATAELDPAAAAELEKLRDLVKTGDAQAIRAASDAGKFPILRAKTRDALQQRNHNAAASLVSGGYDLNNADVAGGGSIRPKVACASMSVCAASAIGHTGAFIWALASVDPILEATTPGQKRSGWGNLIAAELGMIAAAIPGYPACVAAAADITCPGLSQGTAAAAIAIMIIEWAAIVPVDIVTFICSVSGGC